MRIASIRKPLAGIALTGGLLFGGVGIAAAETGATGSTGPAANERLTAEQRCARAQHLWERLESFDEHLHGNAERLVALRDAEAAAGHTRLAERLTARIERLAAFDDRVEARMTRLHDVIAERCATADPVTAPAATA